MSDESNDTDERRSRLRTTDASDSIRRAGTVAYQSLLAALVLGLLIVVTAALGFLVYRGVVAAGPFLLLLGILVGFSLGRLDAVL